MFFFSSLPYFSEKAVWEMEINEPVGKRGKREGGDFREK